MSRYTPLLNDLIPLLLLVPSWSVVSGVRKKTYPSLDDGVLFYGTFKTYGGSERETNGVYSIEDTAVIETWYRDDLKSDCRIALTTGEIYDLLNEPEDINKRHQYLKFKVKRVKGNG